MTSRKAAANRNKGDSPRRTQPRSVVVVGRHRHGQARTPHEIGIVEDGGDGQETMRNSHRVDGLLSG